MTTGRAALSLNTKVDGGFSLVKFFNGPVGCGIRFNECAGLKHRYDFLPICKFAADVKHSVLKTVVRHTADENGQINSVRHFGSHPNCSGLAISFCDFNALNNVGERGVIA